MLLLILTFFALISNRWATAQNLYRKADAKRRVAESDHNESRELKQLQRIAFPSRQELAAAFIALVATLFLHVIKEISTVQAYWIVLSFLAWAFLAPFFIRWNARRLIHDLYDSKT